MVEERTNLGFADIVENINSDEWKVKKKNFKKNNQSLITQAAIDSGFKSRESKEVSSHIQRRRRTGRNMQFNLKARPETIESFCNIADQQGWGLGETLEKAVSLLEKKYLSTKKEKKKAF